MSLTLEATLGKNALHTGNLAADVLTTCCVFKLACGLLKTQVECLLFKIAQAAGELFGGELADFGDFGLGHGLEKLNSE